MDETILEAVAHYDQAFEADMLADVDAEEEADFERPQTADKESNVCCHYSIASLLCYLL